MNISKYAVLVLAVLGFSAAGRAAQQEQWLEYHTSPEPLGYQWINLSTNAPAGAALPQTEFGALYGRWKNGLEKGDGRLICLTRSLKGGNFDTLYADLNGNGSLSDEKSVSATQRSGSMMGFPAAKFTFKSEDGPISYHLLLRFYKSSGSTGQLLMGGGCAYEGEVRFGQKKHRVRLIDSTLNGLFNDAGDETSECDSIAFGGENAESSFLGELVEVDGQFWKIEVARDGAYVNVNPAEGVELGKVKLPEEVKRFEAFGPRGHFTRKPEKGEATLPVATYRLKEYSLERKDNRNTTWRLNGDSFDKAGDFAVAAGKTIELKCGEPLEIFLEATKTQTRTAFDLKLVGALGERVDIMRGTERARAPQLVVASEKGTFRSTNSFEYG